MISFFSIYWWILLLLLVIISVILKKTTKLLIFIVVFVIFGLVFWQLFVAKGFKQSTACFTIEAKAAQEFYEQVSQLPAGEARNQLVCQESLSSYRRLEDCFTQSAIEHKLAFTVFSALPSFKKVMGDAVVDHNSKCPNFPLSHTKY